MSRNSERARKHETTNRLKNKTQKRKETLKERATREIFIAPKRKEYYKHEEEREKARIEAEKATEEVKDTEKI